ncbi:P-loop containing nucleoside triphosphate hydrolase protein [Auriculariales sp. MPI-PUGE-AT-0066]|nr:P-loop containing nucleoside triphosphate hydrolase protein [Auriculariales sp. MPI-PUGE-AT-0066]
MSSLSGGSAETDVKPGVGSANGASTTVGTDAKANPVEPKPSLDLPVDSLLDYKRVDRVYDSDAGEWVLRDSAEKPKDTDDKYRAYSFIVVRTVKVLQSEGGPLSKIELKSSLLKAACQQVIQNFNGISWNSRVLRIEPQVFLAFFTELEDHEIALARAPSCDTSADNLTSSRHLKLLLDFLRQEHGEQLKEIATLKAHGEITFDLLWAVMRPRTLLFLPNCNVTNEPRVVRLVSAEFHTPYRDIPLLRLDTEYVDATGATARAAASDGQIKDPTFGMAKMTIDIQKFKGTQKMVTLKAYPLYLHPRELDMRNRLIERGRCWRDLDGVHHRHYNSVAYRWYPQHRKFAKINVKSRVMVDIGSFRQVNPNYDLPTIRNSGNGNNNSDSDDSDAESTDDGSVQEEFGDALTDTQLLLTSPIVYGFSLSDKLWLEFNVEHVKTFCWNDEAFERLVLPSGQKLLIKSLVESHRNDEANFDFVEGKGVGLVINLHGPPGVGKTLSAEAVSEHVRRPLYVVGAGDLGTDAASLDNNLTEIFSVAATWKAIVLIDEADVFLQARNLHDLARNALVAVFLRHLEYIRGVLFITTNRVTTYDEAFQSRIHVSLRYRDFDTATRMSIWATFLQRVQLDFNTLTSEQRQLLASRPLNGRQIKNVARTAGAVASSSNERVTFAHIVDVLHMMDQFDRDFRSGGRGDVGFS